MFKNKYLWSSFISLGLLLGIAQVTVARMTESEVQSTNQFSRIDQPLPLKLGLTLGGLALISGELWWFLSRKKKQVETEIDRVSKK